jgi:hypothetical protein
VPFAGERWSSRACLEKGEGVPGTRDRFGNPKSVSCWVDRNGKTFAEMRDDDPEARNGIPFVDLGDFIFYSVLVASGRRIYSLPPLLLALVVSWTRREHLFCVPVYHHALPALPISIFLGVAFIS